MGKHKMICYDQNSSVHFIRDLFWQIAILMPVDRRIKIKTIEKWLRFTRMELKERATDFQNINDFKYKRIYVLFLWFDC